MRLVMHLMGPFATWLYPWVSFLVSLAYRWVLTLAVVLAAPYFLFVLASPLSHQKALGPAIVIFGTGGLKFLGLVLISMFLVTLAASGRYGNPFRFIIQFTDFLYRGQHGIGKGKGAAGFKLGFAEVSARGFLVWYLAFQLVSWVGRSYLPGTDLFRDEGNKIWIAVIIAFSTAFVGRKELGSHHHHKWGVVIVTSVLLLILQQSAKWFEFSWLDILNLYRTIPY